MASPTIEQLYELLKDRKTFNAAITYARAVGRIARTSFDSNNCARRGSDPRYAKVDEDHEVDLDQCESDAIVQASIDFCRAYYLNRSTNDDDIKASTAKRIRLAHLAS